MRNDQERHAVARILYDLEVGRTRRSRYTDGASIPDRVIEEIVSTTFESLRERAEDRAFKALESHLPERFKEAYWYDPHFKAAMDLFVTIVSGATLGDIGLTREERMARDKATMKLIENLARSSPLLVDSLGGQSDDRP